jgi:16S rRNA processing protein RimM
MPESRILLGVIGRPHGVRGLVHVTSHTADPAALAEYGKLSDDKGRRFTLAWRGAGVAEVCEVRDGVPVRVADRDAAGRLTNTRLYVERARLPVPEDDEFYLADLIGLDAVDVARRALGRVVAVHDYGAGTSLEIARDGPPLIVPFTRAAVPEVDVAGGRVVVLVPDELEVGEVGEELAPVSRRNLSRRDPSPRPPPTRGGGEVVPSTPTRVPSASTIVPSTSTLVPSASTVVPSTSTTDLRT